MELRVHGIGDHGNLSSQGSGIQLRSAEAAPGVLLYEAPEVPGHVVRFVNWTRTSRSKTPLLWYIALPYTLLNVASFMSPVRFSIIHRVLTFLWGIVLTLGTWLWLVMIAETIVRYVARTPAESLWWGRAACYTVAALLVITIFFRTLRHGRGSRLLWLTAGAHIVALAVSSFWVARSQPAADTGPRSQDCWLGGAGRACVVFEGDLTTRFALMTCAGAVVLAIFLVLLNLWSRDWTWSGTAADPLLGVALLIVASTAMLNVGWSAARLMVEWVLIYVGANVGVIQRYGRTETSDSVLLPWQGGLYGPDMVVGMLTPLLLVAVLALLLVVVRRAIKAFRHWRAKRTDGLDAWRLKQLASSTSLAKWVHGFICDSPSVRLSAWVTALLVLTGLTSAGWMAYSTVLNRNEGVIQVPSPRADDVDLLRSLTVVSVHLLFVVIALILLVPTLRRPFSVLGDVIGYWTLAIHPLAGLPYRPDVVEYLKSEINATASEIPDDGTGATAIVLAGHSQGSVLAFTAIKELGGAHRKRLFLVTCGSPLRSLYSRYFPTHFSSADRRTVREGVAAWVNFWRETDPIACPVLPADAAGSDHDKHVVDPPAPPEQVDREPLPQGLRKHSDYWLEKSQVDDVNAMHRSRRR